MTFNRTELCAAAKTESTVPVYKMTKDGKFILDSDNANRRKHSVTGGTAPCLGDSGSALYRWYWYGLTLGM